MDRDKIAKERFFTRLREDLQIVRPEIIQKQRGRSTAWLYFTTEYAGFNYEIAFRKLPLESAFTLMISLIINSKDRDFNKRAFRSLNSQRESIEHEMGTRLDWHPDGLRKEDTDESRILARRPGDPMGTLRELGDLRDWAVNTMLRFYDTFQPRIVSLVD